MANISKIIIDKYRSIDHVEINFPDNIPVVLIGENNAGKSNIIKAIDLILGEMYPKYHNPEDNEFYFRNRQQAIEIKVDFSEKLGRFNQVKWSYNPSVDEPINFVGIDEYASEKWPRNEERSDLICITVTADRRLSYQLSYISKSTMLSKLMIRFHRAMQSNGIVKSNLETKFDEIKSEFQKIPEFKLFRDSLRDDFKELVSSMTYSLDIDFEAYNPVNFFHALRLQANENGQTRTLEELGTGEEEILALAFAHAYAKAFHGGVLLAIEEPESHLHPLAQDWLAKKIEEMAKDGMQIILTTHSPAFINMLSLDGLALVNKNPISGTSIVQKTKAEFTAYCTEHGVPEDKINNDNIGEFYNANATKQILEGFFAKKVVLVEGPTESLALPIYLQAVGLEAKKEGVAVIPVNGKGNIAKWWRLFTAFNIPVYVIFDNDKDDDDVGTQRKDILKTIGVHEQVDSLLKTSDIHIDAKFAIFGQDFETSFRKAFAKYKDNEDKAKDLIDSGAKPFIARFVAKKLSEEKVEEAGWEKIEALKSKIKIK